MASTTASPGLAGLLLQTSDVTGATSGLDAGDLDLTGFSDPLSGTERALRRQAGGRFAARRFLLPTGAGDAVVETAAYGLPRTTAADALLSQLRTFTADVVALDPSCPLGNSGRGGVFCDLPGLAAGEVGYRLRVTASGETVEHRARAWAVIGRTVLLVGARTTGPELEVDLPALLALARDRSRNHDALR